MVDVPERFTFVLRFALMRILCNKYNISISAGTTWHTLLPAVQASKKSTPLSLHPQSLSLIPPSLPPLRRRTAMTVFNVRITEAFRPLFRIEISP